jgi:hypothetical protein
MMTLERIAWIVGTIAVVLITWALIDWMFGPSDVRLP